MWSYWSWSNQRGELFAGCSRLKCPFFIIIQTSLLFSPYNAEQKILWCVCEELAVIRMCEMLRASEFLVELWRHLKLQVVKLTARCLCFSHHRDCLSDQQAWESCSFPSGYIPRYERRSVGGRCLKQGEDCYKWGRSNEQSCHWESVVVFSFLCRATGSHSRV